MDLEAKLSMTKKNMIIFSIFALLVYFYCKAPSTDSIVQAMNVDIENGKIEYKGVTYTAQWGDQKVHLGDIRYIGRAYDRYAPYIINDAIVTTGEFSDPSIVEVTPVRNGNMYWRSRKQPTGSLIVLHFIPADPMVYKDLKRIKEGQRVEFIGREEVDSKITDAQGGYTALGHSNHRFFILEKVRQMDVN